MFINALHAWLNFHANVVVSLLFAKLLFQKIFQECQTEPIMGPGLYPDGLQRLSADDKVALARKELNFWP